MIHKQFVWYIYCILHIHTVRPAKYIRVPLNQTVHYASWSLHLENDVKLRVLLRLGLVNLPQVYKSDVLLGAAFQTLFSSRRWENQSFELSGMQDMSSLHSSFTFIIATDNIEVHGPKVLTFRLSS